MIKAEVNDRHVEIKAIGNLETLCADLSAIMQGVIEGMSDDDARDAFKHAFVAGFDEGMVLGVSKDEMNNIRDWNKTILNKKNQKVMEAIDSLLDLMNELKKLTEDKPDANE